jgi:hypothetical protein
MISNYLSQKMASFSDEHLHSLSRPPDNPLAYIVTPDF